LNRPDSESYLQSTLGVEFFKQLAAKKQLHFGGFSGSLLLLSAMHLEVESFERSSSTA
jgi:hypothetical protein